MGKTTLNFDYAQRSIITYSYWIGSLAHNHVLPDFPRREVGDFWFNNRIKNHEKIDVKETDQIGISADKIYQAYMDDDTSHWNRIIESKKSQTVWY